MTDNAALAALLREWPYGLWTKEGRHAMASWLIERGVRIVGPESCVVPVSLVMGLRGRAG